MGIFAEFTKKHLCRNLFFDKVNFKIKSLKQMFSGEKCWKPFPQSTTGRLLLIVAISILMKEELANKTVNY